MKVIVSPNYSGQGWYDPRSGVNFLKGHGEISIPKGVDMSNINRHIRLNYLIVVEDSTIEKEPKENPDLVTLTPGKLLAEAKREAEEQKSFREEENVEEESETVETKIEEENLDAKTEEDTETETSELPEQEASEKDETTAEEVEESKDDVDSYKCQYCARVLKTPGGKASHERACKENPDNK